jgi:hypothetical protein
MPAVVRRGKVAELCFTQAINQQTTVQATGTNQLSMKLRQSFQAASCEVALKDFSLRISWPNVSPLYNNTTFSYVWIDGTTHQVVLPSSQLNVDSINLFLQTVFVANGHYLASTTSGANLYFMSLAFDQVFLRTLLTCSLVPTSAPTGFALPAGAGWMFPVSPVVPQFVVPAIPLAFNNQPSLTSFSSLIGLVPGTYPLTVSATFQTLGTSPPALNTVQRVFVLLDKAINRFQPGAALQTAIYSFPVVQPFGELQREQPPKWSWTTLVDGPVEFLTMALVDQSGNALPLQTASELSMEIEIWREERTVVE